MTEPIELFIMASKFLKMLCYLLTCVRTTVNFSYEDSVPLASLAETEETQEKTEEDPDASQPAAEGAIQISTPLISCAAQV
jgi:hypothetical protein